MLLLYLLLGTALAVLPEECLDNEFKANGYFTGQNIDMNYEDSELFTEDDKTKLRVAFYVPRRYTEQYEANAFAITFNRNHEFTPLNGDNEHQNRVNERIGANALDAASQAACYSNRYDNYTHCNGYADRDAADKLWSFSQNDNNDCITDAEVVVPWATVMGGDAFHKVLAHDNGAYTEVFLTATVETWTHFVEGNASQYVGVMSGSEQWLNQGLEDGDINRKGQYGGDGGWRGVGDAHSGDFGNIVMDDERYTLYQIPFILRFPRTVVVETSFKVASPITVLTGVISQDVINLEMNPGENGVFAVLEAVLTTQIQYPYGVRSPDDLKAKMLVHIGGDKNGGGDHAASVEFVEFDEESSCLDGLDDGEMCEQTFKIRITPADATPCSVSGDYFFEFWAECIAADNKGGIDGCTLDDYFMDDDLEVKRSSNGYLSQQISIDHQPFCPLLLDEVRVVGDLTVYHDEQFLTEISSDSVFSNDILFYEAAYRTASAEVLADAASGDFADNDFDSSVIGDDSIIDYVRATKVFMDVTIGQNSADEAVAGWNAGDWDSNFEYALSGQSRIPGSDISGDDITVTQSSGDAAKYNIVLCDIAAIGAEEIQWAEDKPADCFTQKKDTAVKFLDFNKAMSSKENVNGDDNDIDENEVAFKMRMDERIIPLKPGVSDGSHVTVTIESEVYYKGNRHPSRRLLQAGPAKQQSQIHSMSAAYRVSSGNGLETCIVGNDLVEGHLELELNFAEQDSLPSAAGSLDWASRFSLDLESYLDVRDSISIASMQQCNEGGDCTTIYYEGRRSVRRLEGASYLKVGLKVASTPSHSAGPTLNMLQNHIVNRRSDIHLRVSALVNSEVSSMKVPGCGDEENFKGARNSQSNDIRSALDAEESSAAAVSTLLASLVALWGLRL